MLSRSYLQTGSTSTLLEIPAALAPTGQRSAVQCAMGKLDDMRRQREALHGGTTVPQAAAAVPESDSTTGKCSACRKTLALQHDGTIGSHQKGLGKLCPGSRKPPG